MERVGIFIFYCIKLRMLGKSSNLSCQDYSDDLSKELSDLKRNVTLTNMELIDCTNDPDKFITILDELNSEGIDRIKAEEYEESLVYFEEAERILEYAANSGRVIDRNLIVSILHNQACAFQRIYDLPRLSNYLEALLYNLGMSIQNSDVNNPDFLQSDSVYIRNSKKHEILQMYIKRKLSYGKYHLQYCALSSKRQQHEISIKVAYKSIKIFKDVCSLCFNYETNKSKRRSEFQIKSLKCNLSILEEVILNLQLQLNPSSCQAYRKKVKRLLDSKFVEESSLFSKKIESALGTFSIGKIMQILPLTIKQAQSKIDIDEQCSQVEQIRKVLYIAAAYFTIGTELRLLSTKSQLKQQNIRSSDEFTLSQVYHLYCLLIVLIYVPCETAFLHHILTSYNNHYETELVIKRRKSRHTNEKSIYTPSGLFKKQMSKWNNDQFMKQTFIHPILAGQSDMKVEGESKFYLNNQPSSSHSQKKIKSSQSVKNLKNRKIIIDSDIKTSIKLHNEINFIPHIQSQNFIESNKKMHTEISVKKSSSNSAGKKQQSRKVQNQLRKIISPKGKESKKKKTSSKERSSSRKNLVSSQLIKPIVQGVKLKKLLNSKSKEKRNSKENPSKEKEKKTTKEKEKKATFKTTRTHQNTEPNFFSPIVHKNIERTIKKSKSKKSIETKRKLKKTIIK